MFGTTGIVAGAAVAAAVVGGFVWYFSWSQGRLEELNQRVAQLTTAVQTNEQTIQTMTDNFTRFSSEANRLSSKVNEIRTQTSKLAQLFSEVSLDALAENDAQGLQERINMETQQIINDLEDITNE